MKKPSGQKTMTGARRAGFTLIELLTVIAIIAILAGMSAVAVPKYLEKANTTKAVANIENVAKALAAKAAETGNTGGYPPAYGYILPEARDKDIAQLTADPVETSFVTRPYTVTIGIHATENMYEILNWSLTGHDSDGNGELGLLEYNALGAKNPADSLYSFSPDVYEGAPSSPVKFSLGDPGPMSGPVNEVQEQLTGGAPRPFVYVPFNSRQLTAVGRYWFNTGDQYGANIDITDPDLAGRLFFPAPQYDGFVLVGIGPGGTTGGVVADPPAGGTYNEVYAYHMAALRTAFLATRDWDEDGLLDFDFQDRKQATNMNILPDLTNGLGAFIKVVK